MISRADIEGKVTKLYRHGDAHGFYFRTGEEPHELELLILTGQHTQTPTQDWQPTPGDGLYIVGTLHPGPSGAAMVIAGAIYAITPPYAKEPEFSDEMAGKRSNRQYARKYGDRDEDDDDADGIEEHEVVIDRKGVGARRGARPDLFG